LWRLWIFSVNAKASGPGSAFMADLPIHRYNPLY
jgi:hypothetical protein